MVIIVMIILFLQTSVDRFSIIPTAEVSIVDGEFITQLMPDEGKTSSVSISNTVKDTLGPAILSTIERLSSSLTSE